MPVHDWSLVGAGIFHAFHHAWIEELGRALNDGVLPNEYYALPEQHAAGLGPDVLTLQDGSQPSANDEPAHARAVGDTLSDMPLFLEPGAHVLVPLEKTYAKAFAALPRRWRTVLDKSC